MMNRSMKLSFKDQAEQSPSSFERSSVRMNSEREVAENKISFFPTNPNCKNFGLLSLNLMLIAPSNFYTDAKRSGLNMPRVK